MTHNGVLIFVVGTGVTTAAIGISGILASEFCSSAYAVLAIQVVIGMLAGLVFAQFFVVTIPEAQKIEQPRWFELVAYVSILGAAYLITLETNIWYSDGIHALLREDAYARIARWTEHNLKHISEPEKGSVAGGGEILR